MKENIKELENKIIEKAEEEAENIISRAKKAQKRIIDKAKTQAGEILENARNEGKKMLETEKNKIQSEKVIDERKEILTAREETVKQIERDLREKILKKINNGELGKWIEKSCREIQKKEEKNLEMVVREEDIEIFRSIVKNIESISIKKEDIEPGFILRCQNNEYDFRISTLSRNLIQDNREILMKKLEGKNG